MLVLLGAASLFVFPPQLLHEFTCHADSIDSHLCGTDETVVSPQHQHCDILQLFFSPYQHTKKDFAFCPTPFPFCRPIAAERFAKSGYFFSDKNRGPPVLI